MKIQLSYFLILSIASISACATNDSNAVKKSEPSPIAKRQKMNQTRQVEHCKKDLAKRLNINESNISVLKTESVTWRSGAMGCPSPGEFYTQALVPGRLIVLDVDGKAYSYHASINSTPFFCANAAYKPATPLGNDR